MKILKKILSISISCFFIYLCLKDIPLKNLFNSINFNLNLLILAIILLFLINILKALRLKILLRNYKIQKFNFYFKPILIRQFLNTTFIGNIGELVTPMILKKNLKCSYFEGLSIVFSERLIDLSVITFIFGISLLASDLNLPSTFFYTYFIIYFFFLITFLLLVNYKKKIFFIPRKIRNKIFLGYKSSIKNKNILWQTFLFSIIIWTTFIIIDFLIFTSFDVTHPISNLPNVIFLTGIILLSQFVPAAPASVGIFNFFVIETIEIFYKSQGIIYDLTVQIQITSISFIILLIYITPHITWGGYLFYKETLLNLDKIKKITLKDK